MKIACERCEKIGDPAFNMSDWALLMKSRGEEKVYLCSDCYDKFLDFLDSKDDAKEGKHEQA